MEKFKYSGNSDVIRTSKYSWREMSADELIVGKEYEILDESLMQRVFIKQDNKIVPDDSGERYRYLTVLNEKNEEIKVWDGFFETLPL
jgi:hypothetical protein